MVKILQVLHIDLFHRYPRSPEPGNPYGCVPNTAFSNSFLGDAFRLGVSLFQGGDQPHLFARQHRVRKYRVLQHARHDVQSLVALGRTAQRAQGLCWNDPDQSRRRIARRYPPCRARSRPRSSRPSPRPAAMGQIRHAGFVRRVETAACLQSSPRHPASGYRDLPRTAPSRRWRCSNAGCWAWHKQSTLRNTTSRKAKD